MVVPKDSLGKSEQVKSSEGLFSNRLGFNGTPMVPTICLTRALPFAHFTLNQTIHVAVAYNILFTHTRSCLWLRYTCTATYRATWVWNLVLPSKIYHSFLLCLLFGMIMWQFQPIDEPIMFCHIKFIFLLVYRLMRMLFQASMTVPCQWATRCCLTNDSMNNANS